MELTLGSTFGETKSAFGLGRVATQVAHELNNPLGGLKLYAHLVEERFRKVGDTQGMEIAQKVDRALSHLAELVTDITAYGRAPELRRAPVAVNELVEECLTLVQDRVTEHAIRVVRELDPATAEMSLDARELKKATLNLIVNGVDAMEGGGTLTVRTAGREDGGIDIEIADTGCGMDEETRARLFELFYTTKSQGSGLGLAIVKKFAEAQGGRVTVATGSGGGASFAVTLPADRKT